MRTVASPGDDRTVLPDAAGITKHTWSGYRVVRSMAIMAVLVLLAAALAFLVGDPQSAAAAGGKVDRCGGGRIFLDAREKRVFLLHNRVRARHHLPALCVHPALERAARSHSEDMIQRDYFSHATKGSNESIRERIRRFGYKDFYMIAENIVRGRGSAGKPDKVMRAWMNSTGHRQNILNGKLRQIGIGAAKGTWQGRHNVSMYTADFGAKRR